MKRSLFRSLLATGILVNCSICSAAPNRDIPANHWAAGAVKRLTARKILSPVPKFHGDKPVTRYELAVTLDRLVRYLENGHKPLSATKPVAVKMPQNADPATQLALRHLASAGFIAPDSPLLQTDKVVTARELTDVLAQVTIRLSDRSLSHAPDHE